MNRERQAREWLRTARRSAGERVRTRSVGLLNRNVPAPETGRLAEARAQVDQLGIEPKLMLRPNGSSWDVVLEIPDLSHLLSRFPEAAETLSDSRCTVAGSSGRPLARGRLLYGPQQILLRRWPKSGEVLLQFEDSDPRLDFLLRTECLLRPSTKWLFRVASDGLAHQCRTLRVRPGNRYVLVSTSGGLPPNSEVIATEVNCEGVQAIALDLPAALTPGWEGMIRGFGLDQSRTIEIWPAGLAPLSWDGENYGEWIETEPPRLGILSDHPLEALSVSLDPGGYGCGFDAVEPGKPIFLELPKMPVGTYHLRVSAQNPLEKSRGQSGNLEVTVRIREETKDSSAISTVLPLSLEIHPRSPTFEELWEGRVELSISGLTGRSVDPRVVFYETRGRSPVLDQTLPPISLPLQPQNWIDHFGDHLRNRDDAQRAYD